MLPLPFLNQALKVALQKPKLNLTILQEIISKYKLKKKLKLNLSKNLKSKKVKRIKKKKNYIKV